jgi:protein SCO1/2
MLDMGVYHLLSMKRFQGVWAGNVQECSLQSRIGKARPVSRTSSGVRGAWGERNPEEEEGGVSLRAAQYLRILVVVAALGWLMSAFSHAGEGEALPKIGPAPGFTLTTQEGTPLSLQDLHGKIVALTFIYASCADTCPLLTAKMAGLQTRLGTDFGARVFFVSVTVDPERDTPEVLTRYAQAHGANLAGWAFLTGTPAEIRQVLRHYGIYYKKLPHGDVDHTFLTSLIDHRGTLRVQYLGVRFDPEELLRDLQALMQEKTRP